MAARALFVICTRGTTLHSCYMKNSLVFSQSDVRYFFVYIVNLIIKNKWTSTALPPIREIKKFKIPQIIQHSWKLLTPELYNSSQGLFYQTNKKMLDKKTNNKQTVFIIVIATVSSLQGFKTTIFKPASTILNTYNNSFPMAFFEELLIHVTYEYQKN